jgi:hypothetical protein
MALCLNAGSAGSNFTYPFFSTPSGRVTSAMSPENVFTLLTRNSRHSTQHMADSRAAQKHHNRSITHIPFVFVEGCDGDACVGVRHGLHAVPEQHVQTLRQPNREVTLCHTHNADSGLRECWGRERRERA